jgi:hypothetical protein
MVFAWAERQEERFVMSQLITRTTHRRAFLAGSVLGLGALALPGCSTYGGGFSLVEAIRRLLLLSSERAFARLTGEGGFWDQSVARLGLNSFLGSRGDVLSRILTSALFKDRMEHAVAGIAEKASYRAAPIVADAARIIGPANAIDLIRGGPRAASSYLRSEMGLSLVEAMVPEVGDALQLAEDPLVGQLLSGLTGVDITGLARGFAGEVDNVIWDEIGKEEAAIRADPGATRDPVLIGVFGVGGAL